MTRPLRARHRWTISLLAILLPALVVVALLSRPHPIQSPSIAPAIAPAPNPLSISDGERSEPQR